MVDGFGHRRECITQHFDAPCDVGTLEPLDERIDSRPIGVGQMIEGSLHRAEEHVAQTDHELLTEQPRVPTHADGVGNGNEDASRVAINQPFDQLVDRHLAFGDPAGGHDLFERRQCIAC